MINESFKNCNTSRSSNNSSIHSNRSGTPPSQMLLRSHCRASPHDTVCHHTPIWFFLIILTLFSILQLVIFEKYYYRPKFATYTEQANSLSLKLKRFYNERELEERLDLNSKNKNKNSCITFDEARQLVKQELNLYDADKTYMADYALESSGATIVATRCTKNYPENNIKYSINGLVPVLFTSNSPRVVLQPTVVPGDCWSFAGGEGNMVVQLSRTIIPTAFTYEHIRRELSPDLNIDSAPHHFRVKSLRDVDDKEGLLLGEYSFEKDGHPLQTFQVQNPNPVPTRIIELIILTNHGETQYTCLYRFRVHGHRYHSS